MIQAAPARVPRPKAFVIVTALLTIALALCVGGISSRQWDVAMPLAMGGVFLAFGCAFWVGSGGRLIRLLPLAIANLIVAIWPLFRWLAHGDARTLTIFRDMAGFVDALLVLWVAFEYALRRGWAVNPMSTTVRRWAFIGSMFANFILSRFVWPTGRAHIAVFVARIAVVLCVLFWPARNRQAQPTQPLTA